MEYIAIKKRAQKILATLLSCAILIGAITPSFHTTVRASQLETVGDASREFLTLKSELNGGVVLGDASGLLGLSEQERDRFDPYVSVEANGEFKITREGISTLSNTEISRLNSILNAMNGIVKTHMDYVNKSNNHSSYVVQSDGIIFTQRFYNSMPVSPLARSNGRTAVTFHWFGVRVYISASVIRGMVRGISIAGIWITKGTAIKVLGTLGVAAGSVTRGIWFEVNPLTLVTGGVIFRSGWQ